MYVAGTYNNFRGVEESATIELKVKITYNCKSVMVLVIKGFLNGRVEALLDVLLEGTWRH